ncbi:MAG: pyridoxamine 5'-phosphate oxidase family protein [Clostridia bacterium]|nr:pyridoxamine 5'-phosphate oxidase family protein [Clostridia bacterium]
MSGVYSFENVVNLAKETSSKDELSAEIEEIRCKSLQLIESCGIAMVGSSDGDGYPNIKAMLKMETEGLKTFWFSTNTSSKRVKQFKDNPKACVYFSDQASFKGLMFVGEMVVLSDYESRKRLWREGFEVYYPQGVNDPDYSVLCFTANWGNYYHGLSNISFKV